MRAHLGLEDYENIELLDYGCGVKFTDVLINLNIPIKRYVGTDVHTGVIDFLQSNVHDSRFEYFHVNTRNEMYNPGGEPLSEKTVLPVAGRVFDLICLFSVFTHLAPHDFRTLLKLLRRHVKPSGRLFFSLYIYEFTEGGHGSIDKWGRAAFAPDDQRVAVALENASTTDERELVASLAPDFVDLNPRFPLRWAVYAERHARALIQGTGWDVLSQSPPDVHIQHHFLCAPRAAAEG